MEKLNKNKIEYILYHLNQSIDISGIKRFFAFDPDNQSQSIIFLLSTNEINLEFSIDGLPVLFPLSENRYHYSFDGNGNLVFEHDLLKSAFYLLSGYQETQLYKSDHFGRFTYNESIQKKLNIADRPIVNEYFSIIIQGLKEFCIINNLQLAQKKIWNRGEFGFSLTHDVDRVDKWTWMEVVIRSKMVIRSGFLKHWFFLFEAIKHFRSDENPYWNFKWMKNLENKFGFNSTWFFLPQGHPKIDAYYSFDEKRIIELVEYLIDCGDEIALHGTYNSRENKNIMEQNLKDVQRLTAEKITKSRQHWLSFRFPQTLQILEDLGIKYDSSWGFAEHYGWRNSYCLPFHPYDFENDRMMKIQELPLNAMDVTFFQYMDLSLEETLSAFNRMLETCKKYNGLFVLLWHNSHFNETLIPGITEFYKNILKLIADYDCDNI